MTNWQSVALENIANELKNIREILEKQSTTEQSSMVDIVHCRDCKWFIADKPLKLKDGTEVEDNYCSRPNQQSAFLKPTDFCSYGERIEE